MAFGDYELNGYSTGTVLIKWAHRFYDTLLQEAKPVRLHGQLRLMDLNKAFCVITIQFQMATESKI